MRVPQRSRIFAAWAAGFAAGAILLAADSEKDVVEKFFKALDKKDAAAASASLHPEVRMWKLGDEAPSAVGASPVLDAFLGRYPEFPKWSTKIGQRIVSGPWVAVRERVALEPGEKPRESLYLFQVREGKIRRVWSMEGDGEAEGEGAAALLVEKWNERDLPRFIGLFEGGATLWELPSGEKKASGEDELRDRFEPAFDPDKTQRVEVTERMALSPWTIYRSRGAIDAGSGTAESLCVFESRGGLVRRIWYLRSESGIPLAPTP
jgi:hypothetical protein